MKKFLEYIVVLLIILNCHSVFNQTIDINLHINELLILFVGLLFIVHSLSNGFDKKKLAKTVCFLLFYYMYSVLFMLLNDINGKKLYIIMFLIIFPILYLIYNTSKDNSQSIKILEKFPDIMVILSIISVFFYIFGSLTNIIAPSATLKIHWSGIDNLKSYYGLHFNTQTITLFGTTFIRNTGIFTEAPMYSLNLIIALAIQLFICENKSKKKIYILVLTIITTFSTTGIIMASIILFLSLLIKKDKKNMMKVLKWASLPVIFIVLFAVSTYFFTERKQTVSYSTRLDDYNACYMAWKNHPIIGNGYNNVEAIQEYMSGFRKDNQGLSNSILVLLAQSGIYLFILYLIPAIKGIRYGIKNKEIKIAIFTLMILMLFITTIFQYTAMIVNLLAIGYAMPNKKEMEIDE